MVTLTSVRVYDVKHLSRMYGGFETEVRYKERLAQDCGFKHSDLVTTDVAFDVEAQSRAVATLS